jgi:hypothetical protein
LRARNKTLEERLEKKYSDETEHIKELIKRNEFLDAKNQENYHEKSRLEKELREQAILLNHYK